MNWLVILITVVVTTGLVYARQWIIRHQKTHPALYRNRGPLYTLVWFILQIGDVIG
jgi:hypothetical protein